MKNRVLYFPYIRVPQSTWLTQMLLYWDQVSSIVPYQFIQRPESLGPYMQSLVKEGLVFQVMPGQYLNDIPRFEEAFTAYVDRLGPDSEQRRRSFRSGHTVDIHIEKMGEIGKELVGRGIAREVNYPWYEVETETADDFMSYLAAGLGQLDEIDSSPVTDSSAYLRRFVRSDDQARTDDQLGSLRLQILDKVLPVPNHSVEPSAIRAFKDRHAGILGDFRRRVERELIAAASIPDRLLRQRHLDLFYEEAAARIDEIQSAMTDAKWRTASSALSVLAKVPGIGPWFGLGKAVWDAFTGGHAQETLREFAYAAHASAELGAS